METVLVAGAGGELGRGVLGELRRRGYRTRALSRSAERGRVLAGLADEVVYGDATQPDSIARICNGAGLVFSCLGQSVSLDLSNRGPGYHQVDYVAHHHLIAAAQAAGVRRFGYVSVFGAERFSRLAYMKAHADVAAELRASRMSHAIICPTGFFSAFAPLVAMARSGRATLIGDGAARTNPIHDLDLAVVCADTLLAEGSVTVEVGGPEVLTRRQIVEAAIAAAGREARITTIPAWLARAIAGMAGPFAPRVAELTAFGATMFTTDVVAPAYGQRRIAEYFAELARAA